MTSPYAGASPYDEPMRSSLAVISLCLAATALGCGGPEIDAFRVSVTTGANTTDEDVFFCFSLASEPGGQECYELVSDQNDFEGGPQAFEVDLEDDIDIDENGGMPAVEAIRIQNRGGGFLSDGWDLVGLLVQADVDGALEVVCRETDIAIALDAGDEYDPPACP